MSEDPLGRFMRARRPLGREALPRERAVGAVAAGARAPRWAAAQLRSVVVAGALLALLVAPMAIAQGGGDARTADRGDALRQEVRNGTTGAETEIVGKFNATPGSPKGGYVTRQSNTQTGASAGGGAIYGCRGAAGGTAGGSAPCIRANNLADGYAFELAFAGAKGGTIDHASGGDSVSPFSTNATGVAQGLNADRVDGKNADEFLGKTEKAADADQLDGSDSSEFMRKPVFVRRATSPDVAAGNFRQTVVSCPQPGSKAVGGGGAWVFPTSDSLSGLEGLDLSASRPEPSSTGTDTATGWRAAGRNDSVGTRRLEAWVLCVLS